MTLELVNIDLAEAKEFIRAHHRHNPEVTGWKIGVGLSNGNLRGVAVLSRPTSPKVQAAEPRTCEIVRVCTLGDRNANSRLYGAACRAAKALGYLSAITYTRPDESGASLLATGFSCEGLYGSRPGQEWHPEVPRYQENLLGEREPDTSGPKLRWRRDLFTRPSIPSLPS